MAETARNPELGEFSKAMIGAPRREVAMEMFQRAIERGELPADTDLELALDLLAAPVYWRLIVRADGAGTDYLDKHAHTRAITA